MIKVSVIVPAYNVENYISKCLFSLVNQTLEEIEIIVINDGSGDGTIKVIEQYHKQYPDKIVYKTIENDGAANARNVALSMARGEYIGFVDSDDDVDLTMFEKMYLKGKEKDSDIVTCGYNRICLQDIQKRDYTEWECFGYGVYQMPSLYTRNVPYIWNKIFKRTLIEKEKASFEPFRIYEDLIFTYKLFLKANRVERVPETLYNYVFLREGSLTYSFTEKRFDIFKAFDVLINYFEENKALLTFEEELLFVLLNHIYVVCGGDVKWSKIPQKYKFIDRSFRYLDEKFPFWRTTDLYFSRHEKSKFLFTKKWYWKFYTLLPNGMRRKSSGKKAVKYNKAGMWYEKEYQTQKVNENRILLSSQHGSNMNGNMFYILKALCADKEYDKYEIGVVYQKDRKQEIEALLKGYGLKKKNVKLLKVNSKSYTNFLATAKYLFNDTSFPVYFVKRAEQIYLNTWHGTPLKTLGRSTAEDFYDIANLQKNFLVSDYLLYPSEYMKQHMLEDYMLTPLFDRKILMSGYPRNEIFFDEERRLQVRKECNVEEKQCIAYMPTWRGNVRNVNMSQENEIVAYLKEIDGRLEEDQIFYVNLHPYLAAQIDYDAFRNIKAFPKKYETYDFLNACDVLITDYSSVFFDYAVTERKIILFAYDEEEYFKQRGVYLKLSDLPFEKVSTVNELIHAIRDTEKVDLDEYLKIYSPYEEGTISKKICELVIKGKDTGLRTEVIEKDDRKNVMIHLNSFRENVSAEKFKRMAEQSDLTEKHYYYTYDSKNLMGREVLMKKLPHELYFYGKFSPFSMVSLNQHSVLQKIEEKKRAYSFNRKMLSQIFRNEKARAFADAKFDANIVIGKENAREIGYVSECEGMKILYLISKDDINRHVPEWVYEKYDRIFAETEEIRQEMNRLYPNLDIQVKNITSLQDLFE